MNGNHTAETFRLSTWRNLDNLSVPEETSGSKDPEFHDLKRLLSFDLGLQLPLVIEHSDRPDFRIHEHPANLTIGVEHTRAANEAHEEARNHLSLLEGVAPKGFGINRAWFEGHKRKGKQLPHFVHKNAAASPIWGSPNADRAKAAEVANAINDKADTGVKDGFRRYLKNWLLIVDSYFFRSLDFNSFQDAISEQWSVDNCFIFDEIFFLTVANKLPYSQPNGDSLMRVRNGLIESVPPLPLSD